MHPQKCFSSTRANLHEFYIVSNMKVIIIKISDVVIVNSLKEIVKLLIIRLKIYLFCKIKDVPV